MGFAGLEIDPLLPAVVHRVENPTRLDGGKFDLAGACCRSRRLSGGRILPASGVAACRNRGGIRRKAPGRRCGLVWRRRLGWRGRRLPPGGAAGRGGLRGVALPGLARNGRDRRRRRRR
jgi:hypothetical protein